MIGGDFQLPLFSIFNFIFVAQGVTNQLQPMFRDRRDIYETRKKKPKMHSWWAFVTGLIASEIPYLCICAAFYFACRYYTTGFPRRLQQIQRHVLHHAHVRACLHRDRSIRHRVRAQRHLCIPRQSTLHRHPGRLLRRLGLLCSDPALLALLDLLPYGPPVDFLPVRHRGPVHRVGVCNLRPTQRPDACHVPHRLSRWNRYEDESRQSGGYGCVQGVRVQKRERLFVRPHHQRLLLRL